MWSLTPHKGGYNDVAGATDEKVMTRREVILFAVVAMGAKNNPKNKKVMPKWLRLILIEFCAGLLVGVRAFEEYLFYDPFILFFKDEYHSGVLPESHLFKLIAFTSLRYFINTLLSLSVLFLVFKKMDNPLEINSHIYPSTL